MMFYEVELDLCSDYTM